ncbi:MAG: TonB-dependent receptor [Caulobacteraceae bacterium]|nr:MAG: TonB-dependent receptor [Caulobacteraceae bacterium]
MTKTLLFALTAVAPLAFAAQAWAADEAIATAADEPATVEELVINPGVTFRDRSDTAAPVLVYDQEYFQRFEPVSAGDAMKRVPSVTFLSDVLESDGARLRGLDPAYTQILINGEQVPGANADRSFFVDRIPAELVERIEIVRSPSANRSGDAVAGALNIVMRDAYSLDGGYIRGGAAYYDDGKWAGSGGLVWGGQVGPGRLLIGLGVQGRRSPKEKLSKRYDAPKGTLLNIEDQTDVRDGTDYSFNASYEVNIGTSELELGAFFVRTDRLQDEDSIEYEDGIRDNAHLTLVNDNDLDILTDNYALRGRYAFDMLGGRTKVKLGYAAIIDDQFEFEDEWEYQRDGIPFPEDDRFTRDTAKTDLEDTEWTGELSHEQDFGLVGFEFGVQYKSKNRDLRILEYRARTTIPNAPAPRPTLPGPLVLTSDGNVGIEETRLDPYLMFSGKNDFMRWEGGVRFETTRTTITDDSFVVGEDPIPADQRVTERETGILLPSLNARFNVTDSGRINVSLARTVRRPNFDQVQPLTLVEEFGDDDFRGNPDLEPETAWGVDLGYEQRLGSKGVFGVNVFYRDVTDLIEVINTQEEGSGGAGTFLYSVANVGDGKVWGIEFDLSTPLGFMGLDDTGVFLNYSWLDSEITDFVGDRKFNSQSDYVFNVGVIQDLPTWNAAFGITYRKQGDALSRVELEEVKTSYGGDLEIFVEKRFGKNLVIRLTGQNLLDSSKDENFDKFASRANQLARDYDDGEYEIETERAGPVFQIVARYAF